VTAAHDRLLAEGTQLFLRARTTPDPGRCAVELSIGENALEFAPDEVAALFRRLVED
jgi:hypothetical protein